MKAFILAAGKGTRMLELSADKPKHLIQIAGKPFLYYLISNVKAAGINEDDIGIVVSHMKEQIVEFLEKEFSRIKTINQTEPLGTGDAVKRCMGSSQSDFLIINGDNLYSPNDIRGMTAAKGNIVGGYEVEDPKKYGVLQVDGTKLVSIIEKPQNPPSNLINTGIYRFTNEIFAALDNIDKSPRGEYELTDAINLLSKSGKVGVYILKDYWMDFGKPEDIQKVESFLSSR